ncbi:hypothetical protein H310_08657 [Aphanomyces invadans]|uniref:RanBP2-type domain-containing protein n=1 Tax=Aphanomyces invadans TaxID=157072 RepID=A0A024TYV8_9STRA|nr:hypothetical protein H310_08657 [Aphanomyces invadans]ETV98522.1 hypothetical protein H310_08657 [Aphanomyces invadans]|eukprot:XP_008872719.1 hypothetical protein H310_08657 [Aphanomyces invadans]
MHRRPVKGGTGWDCKAENAKAAGLYYEIANVGKVVEASKKRITWRIKMIEGKEYEISLTHSIASGKKVLRIDGIVTHQTTTFALGDWDYCFNLGNHVVHCIIKPSVELNDSYDLIVDGISFRRLPEDAIKAKPEPVVVRGKKALSREPSATQLGSRTDSSSGPWECSACTLINEKPLAPICEACGAAKPKFAVVRQHSTQLVGDMPPQRPTASHSNDSVSDAVFNPFGAPSNTSWVDFDKPEPTQQQPVRQTPNDPFAPSPPPYISQPSSDHIASMLHGLDFNYTPPQPPPPAPVTPLPVEPTAPADPLWGAPIVDLNLNPEAKVPPMKSAKSMQSMEQARLATTGSSTKQLQIPPPAYTAPPPVYGAPPSFQVNPGFQTFAPPQHIVPPQMPNQFATYGAPMLGGGVQPRAPQQQFMANMTNVPPPKVATASQQQRPNLGDPFATLS